MAAWSATRPLCTELPKPPSRPARNRPQLLHARQITSSLFRRHADNHLHLPPFVSSEMFGNDFTNQILASIVSIEANLLDVTTPIMPSCSCSLTVAGAGNCWVKIFSSLRRTEVFKRPTA